MLVFSHLSSGHEAKLQSVVVLQFWISADLRKVEYPLDIINPMYTLVQRVIPDKVSATSEIVSITGKLRSLAMQSNWGKHYTSRKCFSTLTALVLELRSNISPILFLGAHQSVWSVEFPKVINLCLEVLSHTYTHNTLILVCIAGRVIHFSFIFSLVFNQENNKKQTQH